MKVIGIIVNYKTPDMTLDSATETIEQLSQLDAEWKLIVVDNDSKDGSFEKINSAVTEKTKLSGETWGNVEVLQSGRNGGFGAGNNFGMKSYIDSQQDPDYFYILNSDAFPEENSVQHLVNYLDGNPEVGIVGSYIHGAEGDPHITAFRFPTILGELEQSIRIGFITRKLKDFVIPIGIPAQTQNVDWLAGASMMIRREVISEIGMFDEDYFLYFEETDFCFRAKKTGWTTVYVKESSVNHLGSVSTGMKKWKRIPSYWMDSRRHYFVKNHGTIYYFIATLTRLLGEAIWRVKLKLSGEKNNGPVGFVGDLTRHFVKSCMGKQ